MGAVGAATGSSQDLVACEYAWHGGTVLNLIFLNRTGRRRV
jgi:hypothetical protein